MKPRTDSTEHQNAISVEKMRESDAYTIEHFTPSRELMYRAAQGVYSHMEWEGKRVAIISGSGNNGGDGYALAGILSEQGVPVYIYRTSEKYSSDGQYYYQQAQEKGVPSQMFSEGQSLSGYDIVVDCILGTGFQGIPRDLAAAAIQEINRCGAFVVMNGDTGEAELAVKSDLTVSIGFYKTGMFSGKASELIGDLVNVDIGIVLKP